MGIKETIYGTADDFFKGMRLGLSPSKESRPEAIGKTSVRYKGKTYKRYKAGFSPWDKEEQRETGDKKAFFCECGVGYGQYHELGCDCEQCPICRKQLLSCGHRPLFKVEGVRRGFGKKVGG